MAKKANATEVEVSPRIVNKIINDILGHYADLESARGSFMNKARRIREHIQSVIDSAAARGIPPKLTKLQIKIEQTQGKLQALMAELDSEERKLLKKIVVAHGNTAQLKLFDDLPAAVKPPKETKETTTTAAKPRKHPGVSGTELDQAAVAAGDSPATVLQ